MPGRENAERLQPLRGHGHARHTRVGCGLRQWWAHSFARSPRPNRAVSQNCLVNEWRQVSDGGRRGDASISGGMSDSSGCPGLRGWPPVDFGSRVTTSLVKSDGKWVGGSVWLPQGALPTAWARARLARRDTGQTWSPQRVTSLRCWSHQTK